MKEASRLDSHAAPRDSCVVIAAHDSNWPHFGQVYWSGSHMPLRLALAPYDAMWVLM